jgi:hypothetical protein
MNSTPRLRVIGLAAGLAVFALAAGFFLLSRGQASSSAAVTPQTIVPLSQRTNGKAAKRAVNKPAARKPVVRKPAAPKPAAAQNGLPVALAEALSQHHVVVVSLFAPNVQLDDMAKLEARAGAASAGVGFVALDVSKEREARPLTKLLGVLEDPAVLIFRRPSELVIQFSGFADQQTVFQAARNAGL